jgi:hypothetical protein
MLLQNDSNKHNLSRLCTNVLPEILDTVHHPAIQMLHWTTPSFVRMLKGGQTTKAGHLEGPGQNTWMQNRMKTMKVSEKYDTSPVGQQ